MTMSVNALNTTMRLTIFGFSVGRLCAIGRSMPIPDGGTGLEVRPRRETLRFGWLLEWHGSGSRAPFHGLRAAGSAIRAPNAGEVSRLHGHRDPDHGDRHRRQYDGLQLRQRAPAAARPTRRQPRLAGCDF